MFNELNATVTVMEAIRHIATRPNAIGEAVNRGNTFAHIMLRTVPRYNKTGLIGGVKVENPYIGNLFKLADYRVECGCNYANKLAKVSDREVGPSTNGIISTPLKHIAKHEASGKLYLSVIVGTSGMKLLTTADGKIINASELSPFEPAPRKPTEVAIIRPALTSLFALVMGGEWVKVDSSTYPEAEAGFDNLLAELNLLQTT